MQQSTTTAADMNVPVKRLPGLAPLVIAAPFGNYLFPEGCTATMGTFTAKDRGGRPKAIWRCLLTMRYYPRMKGWINKLGLPNPGIDWAISKVESGKLDVSDKLISIHGFNPEEWDILIDKVQKIKPLGIELNMSCPNIGHIGWPQDLFAKAVATGIPIVVKIPPINWEAMFEQAREAGVTAFHCCNTLPAPHKSPNKGGGLSGRPLKGVALQVISQIRKRPDAAELVLIGGGGVYDAQDVDDYADQGVGHVAIATKLIHPSYFFSYIGLGSYGGLSAILNKARERFETQEQA